MIELLRKAPLLSGLSTEQLERVAGHAVAIHLDEGQWLFRQGDPSRRFYFVERGQLRLFRLSPDGVEKVIEIVSPGQTFAEALMFLKAPRYPVCAAALEPTELIGIEAAAFAAMLRESVDTCFVVMGALSRRLRGLIAEIDNLTLHSATSRVARYLLAQVSADRPEFVLEVPKGVLASRLSIQPETFSRVIRQLTQDGVVAVQGAQVTVRDRAALSDLAGLTDAAELGGKPGDGR
ncbi:Crp/Fnr family transcriptional regulator [Candidatus Thiodictyon syntrophicum]|jgi:CRP-like cAMP-binding protein|uniref:Crp/Fnr family transcriptional regulator n=1 Tax=Candidatus Thiodictyon syntrophicum TaxID=1166950 RepID=A0A2K8UIX0_9GAMM|nr:Crp/Fnr family transcriptional regulator [Candidatus Thiodictyon syntrophicum]AUB85467.1 Crp/Fnr family transcriptional regulator [Candidatus Thiodictyon syntrophicum]